MSKKRFLSLLLAALMVAPMAACAKDDTPDDPVTTDPDISTPVTTPAEPEPESPVPDLPDIRFDGTELIIIHNPAVQTYYSEPWIYAESITGDICNDAVFRRNQIIEEKYGVKIVSIEDTNPANTAGLASQAMSDEYDLAMCRFSHTGTISLKGMLHNIADLPYVNYDNPWWDSNCRDGLTVNGKLYGMVSDISMMTLSGVRAIIFNRDLAKNYNLENPYDLVEKNQWTLDKMSEMVLSVSDDLNGDQQYDENDRYGMLTEVNNIDNFTVGSGIRYITPSADGNLQVSYLNEKTINVIEKCRAFLLDPVSCISYDTLKTTKGGSGAGSIWTYGRQLFAADHFLFLQGGAMLFDELNAADMESEYGIVPNPKFDTAQDRYYHQIDPMTSVVTIPSANTEEDLERLGILLEDMAYYSSKEVLPAYYETVIKLRRARVPELGEMMDVIKNSISYQISDTYGIDTVTVLRTAFTTGNPSSAFASGQRVIETKIKQVLDTINELP